MEHWREPFIPTSNTPALDDTAHRRILQDTSGNAQSYALEVKHGSENLHPVQHLPLDIKLHPPAYQQPPILSSNDHSANLLRLHQRRQFKSRRDHVKTETGRSYLGSKKYLDYRARQRRDTMANGEPVWSDDVEDAFQDGKYFRPTLVHVD